ncbi:MAG: 3-methyl-2-oxobutanoate hydroxymethyltransferase [Ignavibacteriae bacterium]|nr:3-methyl-2-oxobutanoate hydroxymethyltransferase [Ignavibacteriota bacterium]
MNSIIDFQLNKNNQIPISIVTCYDFWSAKIIDNSEIDAVLVGDSSAMVMHGFNSTINASVEMIETHVKSVRKGTDKFLIADLPFLLHQKGNHVFMESVDKLMKAGAQALKIEGVFGTIEYIKILTDSGIPVFGHLGLTPQSINKFGGYKVQGKSIKEFELILTQAVELENAGCSGIVLELLYSELAKEITNKLEIPTIGIGAGPHTSGQVLVLQDLLGLNNEFNPKFLKKFLNGYELFQSALNEFNKEVKMKIYPSQKESF